MDYKENLESSGCVEVQEENNSRYTLNPELLYKRVTIDFNKNKIVVGKDGALIKLKAGQCHGFVLGALENDGKYVYLAVYKKPVYAEVEKIGFRIEQKMWDDMSENLSSADSKSRYYINLSLLDNEIMWLGVLFNNNGNILRKRDELSWTVYKNTQKYEYVSATGKYLYQSIGENWTQPIGDASRICAIIQNKKSGKKFYLVAIHDKRECDKYAYHNPNDLSLADMINYGDGHVDYPNQSRGFIWPRKGGYYEGAVRRKFTCDAFLLSERDVRAIMNYDNNEAFFEKKTFWGYSDDCLNSYLIYKGRIIRTENCTHLVWDIDDTVLFRRAQNNYFQLRDENGIILYDDFKRQDWRLILPRPKC